MSDSKNLRKREIKKLIIVISVITAITIITIIITLLTIHPSTNEPCQT